MDIKRFFDRTLSKSFLHQIGLVLGLAVIVFGSLIALRWFVYGAAEKDIQNWMLHIINPANSFEAPTGSDRYWALAIGLLGMIILSGFLISVFNNIIARRIERIQNGQIGYRFKNHIVIIGYNHLCIGLTQQLAEKYKGTDIVLQTVKEVPQIRHELFSNLKSKTEKNIIFISGNRTFEEDLQKLHLHRSKEIFILGETEEEDNDSLNIISLKKTDQLLQKSKRTIRCNVLFQYQSTFAIFQQQDIEISDAIDFMPFNCYETWTQKVLVERKYSDIEYMPLDHCPITADSENCVHLVIIGMSNMGIAMGIQAARLCHFPNFITKGIKTRITFIDEHADREMNFLMGRYKSLFKETDWRFRDFDNAKNNCDNPSSKTKFTDIEFEFIKSRVENPKIQEELAKLSFDAHSYLTIAVCFSFSPVAIAAGLYLPDEIYENKIPVLVQQELSNYMLSMLYRKNPNDYRKYENVKPFGMLDNYYELKHTSDRLPMMINYIYEKTRENFIVNAIPDDSELEALWKRLETAKKWSNRYCAHSIYLKQRSFNINPNEELTSEQINLLVPTEHNRWNIEKLLMGYRPTTSEEKENITTGKQTKNYYKERFIHNDIRPYQTLTEDDNGIHVGLYDKNIAKSVPLILRELEK